MRTPIHEVWTPRWVRVLLPVIAAVLGSCSEGTGPADAGGLGASGAVSDPTGDTFGEGVKRWDLTGLTITQDTGGITVRLDFSEPVIAPTSGATTAMIGFVDLDVDQDSATGVLPTTDVFRTDHGSTGIGADYRLQLGNYAADSTVAMFDSMQAITGRVKPVFTGKHVTIRIPRALLGNDDGLLNAAAIVGDHARPSDLVPDAGHLSMSGTPR